MVRRAAVALRGGALAPKQAEEPAAAAAAAAAVLWGTCRQGTPLLPLLPLLLRLLSLLSGRILGSHGCSKVRCFGSIRGHLRLGCIGRVRDRPCHLRFRQCCQLRLGRLGRLGLRHRRHHRRLGLRRGRGLRGGDGGRVECHCSRRERCSRSGRVPRGGSKLRVGESRSKTQSLRHH